MKSNFTIILFCFSFGLIKAQEKENISYKIINKGKVEDIQPYITAMNKADFKCYRMLNKPRKIIFDTGVEINLEAALDMAAKGIPVDRNCLTDEKKLPEKEPLYTLHQSGVIVELHTSPMGGKR